MKVFRQLDEESVKAMSVAAKNTGIGHEIKSKHSLDIDWKTEDDSKKRIISDIVIY